MRCIVFAVCIVAVGALAAGGAIVVREYALSRSYSSATCRVVNVTYAERDAECTFCEGAVDKSRHATDPCVKVLYPCARVVVNFVDGSGRQVGRGLLYDDSVQASSDEPRCSLRVCRKTRTESAAEVNRYVARYTIGRSFGCFYDTETMDNAIDHKVYTQSDVIHCLLWPLIVVAICVAVFVYVELFSRGLVQLPCGRKDKPSGAHVNASGNPTSSSSTSPHS